MPQFYEYLPQDVVQKGYELYKNFSQNISKDNPTNVKITDLFLVATDHGLEFIEKHSLRSLWLGFVKSAKQLVGIRDETFSIEKNLEIAAKLVTCATQADDKYFEVLAKRISKTGPKVDGQSLRKDLLELGLHLRSLKGHVEASRSLAGKNIDALKEIKITLYDPQKPQEVGKKYHFATFAQLKDKVASLVAPPLTEKEIEAVTFVLSNSPQKAEALEWLEKAALRKKLNQAPNSDDSAALQLALLKAMSHCKPETLKAIQAVLRKIEPPVPEVQPDPRKLEEFAKVFGDAFIAGSGLEGDWSSRPYVDLVKEFIQQKMANKPAAKELFTVLDKHIDLQSHELEGKALKPLIQESLSACTGEKKRCLFLGGWQKHAIVFEIEQQINGKYAFRVYNEGAGVSNHDQLDDPNKSKFSGCIALKDISEEHLFQENFLASLQAFTKMPKDGLLGTMPEEFLVNHLLIMLQGKKEAIREDIQKFLSPQRSGTCTYRSVLAFIASVMPQVHYKMFKFDFKLHLLEQYLPQLKALASRPISSQVEYQERVRQYNLIARCCEKYANGVKKLQMVLPDKEIAKAERILLQYKAELMQLQSEILNYEKSAIAFSLEKLSAPPIALDKVAAASAEEALKTPQIENSPFPAAKQLLIKEIEQLSFDEQSISRVLKGLATLDIPNDKIDREYLYLVDLFVRKMGSIHRFDALRYSNPEEVVGNLQTLFNRIANCIKKDDRLYRTELFGQLEFVMHGINCAFYQLPENVRLFWPGQCTFPFSGDRQTADPLYAKIFSERRENRNYLFYSFSLGYDHEITLPRELVIAINNWWKSDENSKLREQVNESIKKDRIEQTQEIEKFIRIYEDALEKEREKLRNLGPEPTDAMAKKNWKRLVNASKSQIELLNTNIAQTPSRIRKWPTHWPEGFESAAFTSDVLRANFLFTKRANFFKEKLGTPDILPPLFSTFCKQVILAHNLDAKKENLKVDMLDDLANSIYLSEDDQLRIIQNPIYTTEKLGGKEYYPWELKENVYLPDITQKKLTILYQVEPYQAETLVPRTFEEFMNTFMNKEKGKLAIDVDDAKEFYALRTVPDFQIDALLCYLQEHLDKMSQNDWINIVHSRLFESDLLIRQLQESTSKELLVARMQQFFSSSIKNAILTDNYTQAANLLWFASNVQRYVKEPKILSNDLLFELVEKAASPKHQSQWPDVFEALLASHLDLVSSAPVTEEQEKLFVYALFANIKYTECPPSALKQCLFRREAALRTQMHLKVRLSDSEAMTQARIETLVKKHLSPLLAETLPGLNARTFSAENSASLLADDGTKLDLIGAVVTPATAQKKKEFIAPLSEHLVELFHEKALYQKGEDLSHLRITIQGAATYVRDDKKKILIAVMSGKDIFVQKVNGPWMKFIEEQERKDVGNLELKRKFLHLQHEDSIFLVDPKTVEPNFIIESGSIRSLLPGEEGLTVVQTPPESPFSTFEDPKATLYLADSRNLIQKVKFLRLGLSLEQRDGKMVLSHDPQWFLAKEQFFPHFGQSTGFLLFENAKGEKKVMVPVWNPVTPKSNELLYIILQMEKEQSLNFPYMYDFQVDNVLHARFCEYDVKGAQIIPKSLEARYYLASIYLEKGKIDDSEALLENIAAEITSRKLTNAERTILEKIATGKFSDDKSSRTVRLRVKAYFLMKKNDEQFATFIPVKDINAMISCFKEYLNRIGHIRPLPVEEEVLCIDCLCQEGGQESRFINRKNALKGESLFVERKEKWKKYVVPKLLGTTANARYIIYPPDSIDKMRYREARKENRFPFNPRNVSDEDMLHYYNCIREEIDSSRNYKIAIANGLIPTLTYMAFFSSIVEVRDAAIELLEKLRVNVDRGIEGFTYDVYPVTRQQLEGETYEGPHLIGELTSLDTINASSELVKFLPECAATYFTKSKKAIAQIDGERIFNPNCPQAKGLPTKEEFSETLEDLKVAQSHESDEHYELQSGLVIETLLQKVQTQFEKESALLAHQEEVICQTVASALCANRATLLDVLSKKRDLPTIQELCLLSAKSDFLKRAKMLYPELSVEACKKIQSVTRHYLQQKQFVQRLSRAKEAVQDLLHAGKKEKKEIEFLQNDLGRLLDTRPGYDLHDPLAGAFLIIETALNITLRADQVENIRKFALASVEERPIILQMIMGAGKTSVLQPLLAFLFATPEALSTVMVPESLVEPVREGLSNVLGSAFKQSVFSLPYNRELSCNLSYLKKYSDELQEIRQKGGLLLITPREKYSIITSLYHAYFDLCQNDTEENRQRVDAIASICHVLQFKEVSQIDEIDLIMNPLVVFKFPIGAREVVDMERATILSELVIACATDETISKSVSIDFANRFQERMTGQMKEKRVNINKELYAAIVKPQLLVIGKRLLESKDPLFQKLFMAGYDNERYLDHFLTKSTPFDEQIDSLCLPKEERAIIKRLPTQHEALVRYSKDPNNSALMRLIAQKVLFRKEMLNWITKEIPDQEKRELLGVVAKGLSKILPSSLLKECGVKYGVDLIGKKNVARPYEAAGSPKPTQHASPYEQVILSTQLLLYNGVSKEVSSTILTSLQNKAADDMDKNNVALVETESYKLFVEILQDRASNYSFLARPLSDTLLAEFQNILSKSPKWLMYYLKTHVYPQISRYAKSITITPATLTGCTKKANGYSGTLDEGVLARNVLAIPEIGTNGKTINAVQSKAPEVFVVKEAVDKSLPDSIIDRLLQDKERFCWTDSDGWLKEANIEAFTEKLLLACEKSTLRKNIGSIVYHNAEGAIYSLERDSLGKILRVPLGHSQYKPEQGNSLTIIQQKYDTGTNIAQPPNAKHER